VCSPLEWSCLTDRIFKIVSVNIL